MKRCLFLLVLVASLHRLGAVNLAKSTIVYRQADAPLVAHMARVLADDVERVSGVRPQVSTRAGRGANIVIGTSRFTGRHRELRGTWERYAIDTEGRNLYITGSDPRGLAYGVLHVSESIGVSPWYWWADVPVRQSSPLVYDYKETFVSRSPSVKYRGIFINDEDWGLKTWAANTFEPELGDIGPKTYDRVCELILRLRGNMLAPAMHDSTGAFYSHPESQQVAAKWGIMITTSHCEPLLFNNASPSEWDKQRDGEWNYETNSQTILRKLDNRIRQTAPYDNIYTMGMRGLHDEAMKGSTDPHDRARTLEQVFSRQRAILEKHKRRPASQLPQIFVPYKETLDIYDAGLRVPDDITIVWPDDNYGYMKRVSDAAERQRSGGSGVYYHISYLGTPHDHLWLATTAPMLMYHELKKAYDAGADRYWLLNVGDIKPGELETQMFMDMAWDLSAFSYDSANSYQAQWLARHFTPHLSSAPADSSLLTLHASLSTQFQFILDHYYRLAWQRKPEFMGYEIEWDQPENTRLHDTDFSFQTGTAQQRLSDYQTICDAYDVIERAVEPASRPALFQLLGYAVHSACQVNRKFLYAQRNHETGLALFAELSRQAHGAIEHLRQRYNTQLGGKWADMISQVPPGYVARYHELPPFSSEPTDAYCLPASQQRPAFARKVSLSALPVQPPFRLLRGLGTDWVALQLGQPLDHCAAGSINIPVQSTARELTLCLSVVPMWPVARDCSNRIKVSADGGEPVVCENVCREWSFPWKLQVLENCKDFVLTLPLDASRRDHQLTLTIVDPGQIIQQITYQ